MTYCRSATAEFLLHVYSIFWKILKPRDYLTLVTFWPAWRHSWSGLPVYLLLEWVRSTLLFTLLFILLQCWHTPQSGSLILSHWSVSQICPALSLVKHQAVGIIAVLALHLLLWFLLILFVQSWTNNKPFCEESCLMRKNLQMSTFHHWKFSLMKTVHQSTCFTIFQAKGKDCDELFP